MKEFPVRKYLIIIVSIAYVSFSEALTQNSQEIFNRLQSGSTTGGSLQIEQSENIKIVFINYIESRKKSPQSNGYRICIFADTGQEAKKNSEDARSKFISQFEDIRCYTVFKYPWYRVYVGDFRTKSEALKYLKIIEKHFTGAYSVADFISPSSLD